MTMTIEAGTLDMADGGDSTKSLFVRSG